MSLTTAVRPAVPVPVRPAVPVRPTVAYPADGSVRPVGRFTWTPSETEPPTGLSPLLRGRTIAVVGGRDEAAAALVRALTAAGAHPHRLGRPVDSSVADSVACFVETVGRLDGIVDLNLDSPLDLTRQQDWELPLQQSFALLQACYADWVAESDATRLCYVAVTQLGGQMGFGSAGIEQPLGGVWAGLAKGVPREMPNCNVKIVDLAPEHSIECADGAEIICRELYRWGLFEIGYRAGRRYTLVAHPAEVAPPTTRLRQGDVVVMSGGGRGIGFALALALAVDFGCRVIVSGRARPPDPEDPVLALSAEAFRRYRDQRLREAAAQRQVPAARAELERVARDREISRNLALARARGAEVTYVQCDVTDYSDVVRLLDGAGERLVGIVHNAGVDIPARLPAKTPAVVSAVVRVKVQGFLQLFRALQARPGPELAFFCNVGSLTGRWGGMVGQLDYGAANEGLSRLGLWGAQPAAQPGRANLTPVTTVCWPTWDRLGMITNYEATLQYMSALDTSEGVYHWQRELLAGGTGESTFIGDVGPAMVPALLRGYPRESALPGIDRLAAQLHYLGEPLHFRAFQAVGSVCVLRADLLPCCDDFRVDDEPALPLSLCLEHVLSVGAWVLPERRGELVLSEVSGIAVNLDRLKMGPPRGTMHLVKHAEGRWADGAWRVEVALTRREDEANQNNKDNEDNEVARAELVYRSEGPALGPDSDVSPEPETEPGPETEPAEVPAGAGRLSWSGHVFRLARPRPLPGTDGWHTAVAADQPDDLLGTSPAFGSVLGFNALESLTRAGYHRQIALGGKPEPSRLIVERLVPSPATATAGWLRGDADGRDWTAYDRAGKPRLRVQGLGFE